MQTLIVLVFIIGYLFIALEHKVNINKTASALLTGILCWTLFILSGPTETLTSSDTFTSTLKLIQVEMGDQKFAQLSGDDRFVEFVIHELGHHLNAISQIIFFLLGAMTIVELVDAHHGFRFITDRIRTKNPRTLLWVICIVTFFLSSVLDNLTTSIVMVSLIRKLIPDKQMRMFFAGMIIIAANAGGAWTPIGDVTTTMLWIGGQISTFGIMKSLIIPSIMCLLVPLIYLNFTLKGELGYKATDSHTQHESVTGGRQPCVLPVAGGP